MKAAGEMLPVRGVRACLVIGAAGAVAIGVGWYQAAGRIRVADQMNWTMVSVAGTVAIGLATLLWVLAARRAVEQRLGAVLSGAEQTRMPAASKASGCSPAKLNRRPARAHFIHRKQNTTSIQLR